MRRNKFLRHHPLHLLGCFSASPPKCFKHLSSVQQSKSPMICAVSPGIAHHAAGRFRCNPRTETLTDTLVESLINLTQRLGAKAERKVEKGVICGPTRLSLWVATPYQCRLRPAMNPLVVSVLSPAFGISVSIFW
jgi:hypothetical protein